MRRGWLLALGLCLISFLAGAWISAAVFERVPHLEDEVAFLFQARTIAEGRLVAPAPAHPEFFAAPFIIVRDGMWFGKYPPGYPAVLALGVLVGQPWLVNAAAAALSVGLTYLAGRRLYGERVGLLAAALLTISPLFLLHSGALLSHVVCLVWALAALLCFHASQTRRSGWAALGVGLALGALFLSRPLTAVGVGLPLAVWHAVDLARLRWRGRHILAAALGFAPALAGFLAYNRMTTGSAFKTGYELWWPHDKVGFGPGLDSDGYYALSEGLDHAWFNIQQLANYLYGWPLFLSLAPAGVGLALALVALVQSRAGGLPSPPDPLSRKQERGNHRPASSYHAQPDERAAVWDLLLAGIVLSLIVVHIAYWASKALYGPRYYFEALGALTLLSARGLLGGAGLIEALGARLAGARRAGWARPAVLLAAAVLTIFGLTSYLPGELGRYTGWYGVTAAGLRQVQAAGLDEALVFVRHDEGWIDYAPFFAQNDPLLGGRVVYALDLGAGRNPTLMGEFPRRAFYYFGDGRLMRLEPPPSIARVVSDQ